MRRRYVVLALASVATLALVIPAFGAPSPLSLARKALKIAKRADQRSARALRQDARSGPPGPPGQPGPAGATNVTVVRSAVTVAPRADGQARATCPSGHLATGGGVLWDSPGLTVVSDSGPVDASGNPALTSSGTIPVQWFGHGWNSNDVPRTM